MNKTVILITAAYNEVDKTKSLKREIIEYVGNRLIADVVEDSPAIILNTTLNVVDKNLIAGLVNKSNIESAIVLFVEADEDGVKNQFSNHKTVTIKLE